jgi:hypothetical protein
MSKKINWNSTIYLLGIIAMIIGAIDPLEGSIAIGIGSALLVVTTYVKHDRHWRIFLSSFVIIIFGIIFMFYLSSLGGFGGTSTLSWWWCILIAPYPLGWLITIITLILRTIKKIKQDI